jgi:hypothetical protein
MSKILTQVKRGDIVHFNSMYWWVDANHVEESCLYCSEGEDEITLFYEDVGEWFSMSYKKEGGE